VDESTITVAYDSCQRIAEQWPNPALQLTASRARSFVFEVILCNAFTAAECQAVGRLGQCDGSSLLVKSIRLRCPRPLCRLRHAGARCAGVVPALVVRIARCAARDRVLHVAPVKGSSCRCGSVRVWYDHAGSRRASVTSPPNPPFQPTAARTRSLVF
jgi:hypothetical protein